MDLTYTKQTSRNASKIGKNEKCDIFEKKKKIFIYLEIVKKK